MFAVIVTHASLNAGANITLTAAYYNVLSEIHLFCSGGQEIFEVDCGHI